MFNKIVAAVLFLSVISSAAFASGFKKGDLLVCNDDNIQVSFLQDSGKAGALVSVDLGDNQPHELQAQPTTGNSLLISVSDCPDESQCWEASFTFKAADIVKSQKLNVLISSRLNSGKTNYHTSACVVK